MEIKLKLIATDEDRNIAKSIVENHHSYVPTFKSVGRRIDWIVEADGEIVGMIGIGSSTYPPCKDILTRLGKTKSEYREIFNTIANNWRFCMCKKIPKCWNESLKTPPTAGTNRMEKEIWR